MSLPLRSEIAWRIPTRDTLFASKSQAFEAWADDLITKCLLQRLGTNPDSQEIYLARDQFWGVGKSKERQEYAEKVRARWASLLEATCEIE